MVVVSGNSMNDNLGICIACPLSSKIKKYDGCLVLTKNEINGLDQDSEVITFKIRTISGERFIRKIGEITVFELDIIKKGLNEIMTY